MRRTLASLMPTSRAMVLCARYLAIGIRALMTCHVERIAGNVAITEGHALLKADSLVLGKSTARSENSQ